MSRIFDSAVRRAHPDYSRSSANRVAYRLPQASVHPERQTTGGYPKPADVISADFWRLGQMHPCDEICVVRVTVDEALLLQQREEWL